MSQPRNVISNLEALVDWAKTNNLPLNRVDIDTYNYRDVPVELTFNVEDSTKEEFRQIKRACGGRMKVEGEAPYLRLEAVVGVGRYAFRVIARGAYKCEYSCKPNENFAEELTDGEEQPAPTDEPPSEEERAIDQVVEEGLEESGWLAQDDNQ